LTKRKIVIAPLDWTGIIGRNKSEETKGSKVGERLDEAVEAPLERKASLQRKVGEEGKEDAHDLAARKQP
jgi:hypothetical protein